jgi:hypothetical protein
MPSYRVTVGVHALGGERRPLVHIALEGDHPSQRDALDYVVGIAQTLMPDAAPREREARYTSPRLNLADVPSCCPRCEAEGDGPYPWWGEHDGACTVCAYPDPDRRVGR